jgi:hypothetical protein
MPLNIFIRSYVKSAVCGCNGLLANLDVLEQQFAEAVGTVTPEMLRFVD